MNDGAPFTFAGVWDRWKQNGRTLDTCAIITTTANELLSTIHHRMPVILEAESYDLWLKEDSRATDLKELLAPYPADAMTSHAVSYDVNDAKLDDERLVLPAEPNIASL
jgi:putative SOS response-associated peptidase YedK